MTVSEKIRTSDNKIEQSNVEYDLDRQTATILSLSSGNVGKHDFLTGSNEYSPIASELKKQADVAKKQYQILDKVYEFDNNV